MEIRALTGFNETTRRRYGRSYTPLNGVCLGAAPIIYDRGYTEEKGRIEENFFLTTEQKDPPKDLKKYIKPILIAVALGGLFYILKNKKII
jgi:hypothetical protein